MCVQRLRCSKAGLTTPLAPVHCQRHAGPLLRRCVAADVSAHTQLSQPQAQCCMQHRQASPKTAQASTHLGVDAARVAASLRYSWPCMAAPHLSMSSARVSARSFPFPQQQHGCRNSLHIPRVQDGAATAPARAGSTDSAAGAAVGAASTIQAPQGSSCLQQGWGTRACMLVCSACDSGSIAVQTHLSHKQGVMADGLDAGLMQHCRPTALGCCQGSAPVTDRILRSAQLYRCHTCGNRVS